MKARHERQTQSQKGQVIVLLYYSIKFRGIAAFHMIAFISVTSTNELKHFDIYKLLILNKIPEIM